MRKDPCGATFYVPTPGGDEYCEQPYLAICGMPKGHEHCHESEWGSDGKGRTFSICWEDE